MLTVDELRNFGANVNEGLSRCLNNEAFYLRMVKKSLDDGHFGQLEEAIRHADLQGAFEAAHALKGVMGNLALTPLFQPISEMTELLRSRTDMNYTPYMLEITDKYQLLKKLAEE